MAKASDCGSEDRGFESHYPPHKRYPPQSGGYLLWGGSGLEKPGTDEVGATDSPVDCQLGRGRVHKQQTASRRDVGGCLSIATPSALRRVSFMGGSGLEKPGADEGGAKSVRSNKFRFDEQSKALPMGELARRKAATEREIRYKTLSVSPFGLPPLPKGEALVRCKLAAKSKFKGGSLQLFLKTAVGFQCIFTHMVQQLFQIVLHE